MKDLGLDPLQQGTKPMTLLMIQLTFEAANPCRQGQMSKHVHDTKQPGEELRYVYNASIRIMCVPICHLHNMIQIVLHPEILEPFSHPLTYPISQSPARVTINLSVFLRESLELVYKRKIIHNDFTIYHAHATKRPDNT